MYYIVRQRQSLGRRIIDFLPEPGLVARGDTPDGGRRTRKKWINNKVKWARISRAAQAETGTGK